MASASDLFVFTLYGLMVLPGMVVWSYGRMVVWSYGRMVVWSYGRMVVWSYGLIEHAGLACANTLGAFAHD
jgi:hypothetical protein